MALYDAVLAVIDLGPDARLLDAGCGSGVFAKMAAETGAEVSGLDAAPALIERARERVPRPSSASASWRSCPTRTARSTW